MTASQTIFSASAFIDSLGVNASIGNSASYSNAALMHDSLAFLGISKIRAGLTADAAVTPVETALAAQGFKFDFVTYSASAASGASGIADFVSRLAAFETANPGSVAAVEGLNEEDIQAFSYQGSSTTAAATSYQQALNTAVRNNSVLGKAAVYNFTISDYNNAKLASAVKDGDAADYANAHAYASTSTTPSAALEQSLRLAEGMASGKPVVITETGYTTLQDHSNLGVDETVQAKSILNTLMDACRDGVSTTYLYELFDNDSLSSTDREAHFGLFNADGTPKLAATAIHNLTTILSSKNANAIAAAAPSYTLGNMPSTGNSLMMAKADGSYDLMVWAEPKIWDAVNNREIAATAQPVTVNLGGTYSSVTVYDPMSGTKPIATYSNVQTITVPVTDHPIVIEVAKTGTTVQPITSVPPLTSVSGTAAQIVAKLPDLSANTSLQTISLTDSHTLPVASFGTMQYIISHYARALSAIQGGYQFSVTTASTGWSKTVNYDSSGKLVSTLENAFSGGKLTSTKLTYASGASDTTSYNAAGQKVGEVVVNTDGSRECYAYDLTGLSYTTAKSVYSSAGKLTSYTGYYVSGVVAFQEVDSVDGSKQFSWYNTTGKITSDQSVATNGSVTTSTYKDGVKTASYVVNADNTKDNYYYGITGQNYVSEHIRLSATGSVLGDFRYAADGSVVHSTGSLGNSSVAAPFSPATATSSGTTTTSGASSTNVVIGANGDTTTSVYKNGVLDTKFVKHADGSQDHYLFSVTGKAFTNEHDHISAKGEIDQRDGYFADGTIAYTQTLAADGTKFTTTYGTNGKMATREVVTAVQTTTDQFDVDGAITTEIVKSANGEYSLANYTSGVKSKMFVAAPDKSQDNLTYRNVNGAAVLSSDTHINSRGAVDLVTQIAADGSELVHAYAAKLVLSGGSGNDVLIGAGSSTYAFAGKFGNDTIQGFAGGNAAGHDTIELSKSVVPDFAHLDIAQRGANAVITVADHGSITLSDTSAAKLSAANFSFV